MMVMMTFGIGCGDGEARRGFEGMDEVTAFEFFSSIRIEKRGGLVVDEWGAVNFDGEKLCVCL